MARIVLDSVFGSALWTRARPSCSVRHVAACWLAQSCGRAGQAGKGYRDPANARRPPDVTREVREKRVVVAGGWRIG